MRILFLTAFYPPFLVGGWEQLVEEMNLHLQESGHVTRVLTSDFGAQGTERVPGVDRVLKLEAELNHYDPYSILDYRSRVRHNLRATRAVIGDFSPDVVFTHIMWNLSRGVPWTAEQLCPGRVAYYVADHSPCSPDIHADYWLDKAITRFRGIAKRAVSPMALAWLRHCSREFQLEYCRVLCVSRAIRDELLRRTSIQSENLHVVYNGVDTELFSPGPRKGSPGSRRLSLLVAGSLVPHKGVDTAIEALNILRTNGRADGIDLTIVGSGHPDYESKLKSLVTEYQLNDCVHFLGRVERGSMPEILRQHDVLVFPSRWEEPLARMVQEAMAAGLVVVGTLTGGTGELLVHGQTGLTFPPDSAEALADRIAQLQTVPQLGALLAERGRNAVVEGFDIHRVIKEVEAHLEALVNEPLRRLPTMRSSEASPPPEKLNAHTL